MKVTRTKLKACHAALSLALILLTAFAVPLNTMADDFAFSKIWTTVGSAGTVDESDLDKVDLLRGTVTMKPGDEPSRAVIRYNVVAVDGLFAGGDGFFMGVRFRDNGDQAQVIARLIEYDFNTGAYRTLLTFDSNAQAAAPAYQTGSAFDCRPDWRFEFGRKAYFVEATLIRTGADGNPALGIVTIGPGLC